MSQVSTDSTLVNEVEESIEAVAIAVGKVAREENDSHSVTIVISDLPKKRLRDECKYRGWSKLKGSPPIHVTTADALQETIDTIKPTSKRTVLNLLASSEVPEISFNVPSHFDKLKVLRCASKRDKGKLLIDGSSTYHHIRLDKWEAHRHKYHTLILGYQRGVRIKLASIAPNTPWSRIVRNHEDFKQTEVDEILQLFEKLAGTNGQWDEIKGTVAAILSLVIGTYKSVMGMKAGEGGIDVRYAFGITAAELGVVSTKLAPIATAAGPAVALGVVAAAAVYFIPWDMLFDYLKSGLSWIWDKICKLWEKFKCWVRSLFTGASETPPDTMPKRAMTFSR
ncbi:uncharacterized protein F4807DRAFT_220775 [Annulohypoxylon truncatum]|uniref:uncharacterized protein n=1 Tax=Annulohypoxylon truncatum TaxID=327061 RepID=UPI002007D3D5|nr:uncharacterized protein F4807DRAFT_220775 [Annulohypoxylon truncatum]KAI1206700.1 hypothetical protein F4807DRAFT_220775 [Annulohypoxylon truncatum]